MIMDKVKIGKYSLVSDEWNLISTEAKSMISKMLLKGMVWGDVWLDTTKRYSV